MRIIVTGGAGFIGSHLTDALIKEGHQVMILDNFSSGNKKYLNPKAFVKKADICSDKSIKSIFASFKPQAVFHLAALIDVRISMKSPKKDYDVNVGGSMNILEACREYRVGNIIFSSSGGAVYGDATKLPTSESCPPDPLSPYGTSKFVFEEYLKLYHKMFNIKTIILRYPNIYGPRQGSVGEGGVIAVFCKNILSGKDLKIFGSGKQTRDFVFVGDIVKANIKALKSKLNFGVFNISSARETSVNQITEKLLKLSKAKIKIKHINANKGEVMRSRLSNALAKKDLKWSPGISLEKGLAFTWEWFEDNYNV